jgi:predicted dehydrogenase
MGGTAAGTLRVGVVGVHGIGQAHLWALRSLDTCALAAVCDTDADRAQRAGADHQVPVYTDAHAMYAGGDLDAVVVATPPGTHGDLVRAALDAGLHVYCEKPIAPTCDEGYALAAHARRAGRTLQVGFQYRFHKGYAAMRDAYAGLGRLQRAELVATNWFRAQAYFDASPWRATWRMAGGGVLMSQAVHQLDALVATAGMPARVRASVANRAHRAEVEDHATAEFEWDTGAARVPGHLVASLCEPAGVERFEFQCERGAVTLADGYDVRVARHDAVHRLVAETAEEFPADPPQWEQVAVPRARGEWFDMFVDAHRDFAAAIASGRAPVVDGEEGTRCVELANAVYLSALTRDVVELPLAAGVYPPVFEELATGRSILGS